MNLSPALNEFLSDMEYPATKDDLVREATREGLIAEEREVLASLPGRSFDSGWDVRLDLLESTVSNRIRRSEPVAA